MIGPHGKKLSTDIETLLDQHLIELILFLGSICPDIQLITRAAGAAIRATAEQMQEDDLQTPGEITDALLVSGQDKLARIIKGRLGELQIGDMIEKRVLEHQVHSCLALADHECRAPRSALLAILEAIPADSSSMLLLWAESEDNTQVLAQRNRKTNEEIEVQLFRTLLQVLQQLTQQSTLFWLSAYPDGVPTIRPQLENLIIRYLHGDLPDHLQFELNEYLNAEPSLAQLLSKLKCLLTVLQVTRRPQILERIAEHAKKVSSLPRPESRIDESDEDENIQSPAVKNSRVKHILIGFCAFLVTCLCIGGSLFYLYSTTSASPTDSDDLPSLPPPSNEGGLKRFGLDGLFFLCTIAMRIRISKK